MVVEHGDRLTRFGFEQVASLASAGRRIVVLFAGDTCNDLAGDVGGVLASLCARCYRRGSGSRRAARAVAVATGGQPV
jgi:putative resolvase